MSSLLPGRCSVTVVNNCFVGLECIAFTQYDVIFVRKDLISLSGEQLVIILRGLGMKTPVVYLQAAVTNEFIPEMPIALHRIDDPSYQSAEEHIETLWMPYSSSDIVRAICRALCLSIPTPPNHILSSLSSSFEQEPNLSLMPFLEDNEKQMVDNMLQNIKDMLVSLNEMHCSTDDNQFKTTKRDNGDELLFSSEQLSLDA